MNYTIINTKQEGLVLIANVTDRSKMLHVVGSLMQSVKADLLTGDQYTELGDFLLELCAARGITTELVEPETPATNGTKTIKCTRCEFFPTIHLMAKALAAHPDKPPMAQLWATHWVAESGRDCDRMHSRGRVSCFANLAEAQAHQRASAEGSDGFIYTLFTMREQLEQHCMDYGLKITDYLIVQ